MTCRDIIALALRQAGLLRPGGVLNAEEARDGLSALQTMFDQWRLTGMFGELTDVYKDEDYEAAERERVTAPTGVAVTFPATISDCGEDRAPRDLSMIESIINGVTTTKIFDQGEWVSIRDLDLTTDCPLAGRGSFGLAAVLASFMAPAFGGHIAPETMILGRQFLAGIAGKVGSTQDNSGSVYF
jgi:hypothetical protein